MVGWHRQFNGLELGQTPGDNEGQRGLVHFSPWCLKESGMTQQQQQKYENLKENKGEKSDDNEFGNDFWILHPDHGQQKKTQTSQTSLKLKMLLHQKTISAE